MLKFSPNILMQGVITTSKNLDREAPGLAVDADGKGVYTLIVQGADHGSPVQRATATVKSTLAISCYKNVNSLNQGVL